MLTAAVRLLGVGLLALLLAVPARAQQPVWRTIDRHGAEVYELVVDWPRTMADVRDSIDAQVLDPAALLALSQGLVRTSHELFVQEGRRPAVRVLAADYDEIRLPLPSGATERTAVLDEIDHGAAAAIVGVGWARRRLVGSLEARLLQYNTESQTLRRYRRLVLAVDGGAAARVTAPGTRAGTDGAPTVRGRIAQNPHLAVDQSVLSEGTVYKVPVVEEGVYRIDRAFLQDLGVSVDGLDPRRLKIYGNGGRPLPAVNNAPRIADLAENPVLVTGEADGRFDADDALYFFAEGPTTWAYDTTAAAWTHTVHPYSDSIYYFLKVDGPEGQRVATAPMPTGSAANLATATGRYVQDWDRFMWGAEPEGSGLTWVSTQIGGGQSFTLLDGLSLPGQVAGDIHYEARAAVYSNPAAALTLALNGETVGSIRPGIVGLRAEDPSALADETRFVRSASEASPLTLTMTLQERPNRPLAAADWVRVVYPRAWRAENDYLRFPGPTEPGRYSAVLRGFSAAPLVWDVTEPGRTRQLAVTADGDGYRIVVDVPEAGAAREFVAFLPGSGVVRSLDASLAGRVVPQNLHGIASAPALALIAPRAFLEPAAELAERRRQEGLTVVVAPVEEIYNEFSGGTPDMRAVRDYLKFLYDLEPTGAGGLRYALLFGDGHFNFRSIHSTEQGEEEELRNWILPYQTVETFDPIESYTSDDYFGLLDDEEGGWPFASSERAAPFGAVIERVDIGVGRLPVQTLDEAYTVLEKIKRYEDPATYGAWRSRYTYLADDGKQSTDENRDFDLHVQNIDAVASVVDGAAPQMNPQKIYALSFERVFRSGWRFPEVRERLMETLNRGTLVFNYSGHGGPDGLADENIFMIEDAEALTNGDRLFLAVTATCSFGRWDIDTEQSGAEALVLNPNGGAVAIFTTVRLVYTSGNIGSLNTGLNRALNAELFQREPDGRAPRLGDVMQRTKNTSVGIIGNSRKFNLLGDPSMRFGLPEQRAVVTRLNGQPLGGEAAVPLRALERVTIEGEVQFPDSTLDAGFDGLATLTVYDAQRRVPLPEGYRRYLPTPYYTIREDLIWRGEVSVAEGRFAATFVVPKDISYSNLAGRISAYASSSSTQALGYSENVIVGGTAANAVDDASGPRISLFLNDTTFVDGSLTTPDPELIVQLFDESGVNTVGAGVGHELLLVINDNEEEAIDISSAFESEPNSYQRGSVRWPLGEQAPGLNQLSVRAWDVVNNSATSSLAYRVAASEALVVDNVYNYPNPTTGPTAFLFEHNQPDGTPARVRVRVYTLAGRLVKTLDTDLLLSGGPAQIRWNDGLDDDFDRLATGVYLYQVRVEVETPDGTTEVSEHIEKLAVIR